MKKRTQYKKKTIQEEDRKLLETFAEEFQIREKAEAYASIYTPEVLYLFRWNAQLSVPQEQARVLAEAMYLIHRGKYGRTSRRPGRYLCIVTREEALILKTEKLKEYYLISKTPKYDWDLEPDHPDLQLLRDLGQSEAVKEAKRYHLEEKEEKEAFAGQIKLCQAEEQLTIFDLDKEEEDPKEQLQEEQSLEELYQNRVLGRAVDESRLRLTGEFYTPLTFAERAMVYLGRVIGPQWWTTGKYRLWDMAAGTGNLEYVLPPQAQRYCYLSTISEEETQYCRNMFPGATVFQYDYLNDDVDFMEYAGLETMGIHKKMPAGLQADLENPDIRWIILLNPPCQESPDKGSDTVPDTGIGSGKRIWRTTTKIQECMIGEGLGKASRELLSQFLYRIHREFAGKTAYLGLLSRLNYLTAAHNEGIRSRIFSYQYEKGFLFSSMNFPGCCHKFPYGFLVWNLKNQLPLEEQMILADVYNREVEKIDTIEIQPGKTVEVEGI